MVSNKKNTTGSIFDFLTFPLSEVGATVEGECQRGVLVVSAEPASPELDEFLQKIMTAVGCDLGKDAGLVRVTPNQKFRFTTLAQKLDLQQAIFFGVLPGDAGLNFKAALYRPMQVGGKTFLFADQLSKIHSTPALKRPLWEGLKMVFGN